jgi:PAS domain S-box-containing protein
VVRWHVWIKEHEFLGKKGTSQDGFRDLRASPTPKAVTGRNLSSEDLSKSSLQGRYEISRYAPVCLWEEDFSEVKQAFDDLRNRGIRDFRRHFEKHPEEILSFAGKVKINDVNEYTLELYQAKTKEDLLKGLEIVFSKQSYEVFKEELIALADGKTRFMSEAVNRTLNGEQIHILLSLAVPPGYKESLSRVIVCITDISAKQRKARELERIGEKYRKIFQNAIDAMFVADTETGIIMEANESAGKLLGMSTIQMVGMHFTEFHPKEEREAYRSIFEKHASRGRSLSDNLLVCQRNGRKIPVLFSSSIISLDGRNYIVGMFRRVLSPDHAQRHARAGKSLVTERKVSSHAKERLSGREREVLTLIAGGMSNRQMAEILCISEKTVETHRTRVMNKLNLHKTADLVRYAIASGFVS